MTSDGADHVPGQKVIESNGVPARGPSREQLILAIVEGERKDGKRTVPSGQAKVVRDADCAEPHIGMAQHHALRPARRAGSIEQGRKFVRVTGGLIERLLPRHVPRFDRDQSGLGTVGIFKRPEACFICDQQLRAAVREDVRRLRPLQNGVDWNMDKARAGGRQR